MALAQQGVSYGVSANVLTVGSRRSLSKAGWRRASVGKYLNEYEKKAAAHFALHFMLLVAIVKRKTTKETIN